MSPGRPAGRRPAGIAPSGPGDATEYTTSLLQAALGYTKKGWPVFPLKGKRPLTAHGFHDASTDEQQIQAWWTSWPDAGIGIPTGHASGLLALDVDPRNGGKKSFHRLQEEHGHFPDTLTQATGGGGTHLLFRLPAGLELRCVNGLFPGIDLKADGGYIVVAPSLHPSGKRYEWERRCEPAQLPPWIIEMINRRKGVEAFRSSLVGDDVPQHLRKILGTLQHVKKVNRGWMARCPTHDDLEPSLSITHKNGQVLVHCFAGCAQNAVIDALRRLGAWPARENASDPLPGILRLSSIEPQSIHFIAYPYLPCKFVLLEGDPGIGKSHIALALAAGVTLGRGIPGMLEYPRADVLIVSCEDGVADTIRPRFDGLGGDPRRAIIPAGFLTLDSRGLLTLQDWLAWYRPRLVILDPLTALFETGLDIHRGNHIRSVTRVLASLSDEFICCILGIRHLTKASRDKAIYRGLGGIDFAGQARSILLAGCDSNDPSNRAIVHIKCNVAPRGESLGFTIDKEGRFFWTGKSTLTASDILAPEDPDRASALGEAKDFLLDALSRGAVPMTEIEKEWTKELHGSTGTLRRAKRSLGIKSSREGVFNGPWFWKLPVDAQAPGCVDAQGSLSDSTASRAPAGEKFFEHLREEERDNSKKKNHLPVRAQPPKTDEHLQGFEHLRGHVDAQNFSSGPLRDSGHLREDVAGEEDPPKRCTVKRFSLAAADLLTDLVALGCRLELESDGLVVEGRLTDELRHRIRENKAGLLELVRAGEHRWRPETELARPGGDGGRC